MLVDHMSAAFLPETSNVYSLLRFTIGRISYPLFLVVFIEGFFYTKNRKKHLRDLLLFGLISEPVFDFAIFGKWVYWGHQNVLLSFFLCFLMLCCFEKVDERKNKSTLNTMFFNVFVYLVFCVLAYITKVDYDLIAIMCMTILYVEYKEDKNIEPYKLGILVSTIISIFTLNPFSFLSVPILYFYDRNKFVIKRSKGFLKYVFYVAYPFHLAIISLIKCAFKM